MPEDTACNVSGVLLEEYVHFPYITSTGHFYALFSGKGANIEVKTRSRSKLQYLLPETCGPKLRVPAIFE